MSAPDDTLALLACVLAEALHRQARIPPSMLREVLNEAAMGAPPDVAAPFRRAVTAMQSAETDRAWLARFARSLRDKEGEP